MQSPQDGFLYPPLGDITRLAMGVTSFFLLVAAGIVFLMFRKSRKHALLAAIICGLALLSSFGAYVAFKQQSVRVVPIPRLGTAQAVSVGDERTDFAKKLGNVDDYELLRDRGPYEEEVEKLWTARSLTKARFRLWLSYTGAAFFWVCFVSILVMEHASELALHPASSDDH